MQAKLLKELFQRSKQSRGSEIPPPHKGGFMTMATDTEVKIDQKIEKIINEPGKYNVIFLNDNHTPMEFVIEMLVHIYKHSNETAQKIMLDIHNNGSGIAGTYTFEIAEQKGNETVTLARGNGFPLNIKIEKA